jgi:hypothetical protein
MVSLSANRAILKKVEKAEKILQQEREELLRMVTASGIDDFGSARDFLPLIEEDAKYRIRALGLPHYLLKYYLNKLCDIYGPYSGDQPDKRKKYYDNDIYLSD